MTKTHVDPEYEQWYRQYPRFPGVAKCVELLRSPNVHGAWIDIICYELEEHAHENAQELIRATRTEININSGVGRILLHVVADSKLPEAFDLFAELLQSPDETLRPYGVTGLKQLDTKAARRLLWQHGAD
jgi:hypothetical protein